MLDNLYDRQIAQLVIIPESNWHPGKKKAVIEELTKDSSWTSKTTVEIDTKVHFLINDIYISIAFAISNANMSLKSISRFGLECKKI